VPNDTGMAPGPSSFPSTHWSIVRAAREPGSPECRDSIGRLIDAYWRPVYAYIRHAWSRSPEDAKDLTQDFLSRMVGGSLLAQYDRDKGRFRAYLKGALRHFLMDVEKTASRQKRGGGASVLSLDFENAALDVADAASTPDEVFDRAWASTLMREAIAELGARLRREGRAVCFEVFESYEGAPGPEKTSYENAGRAKRLSVSEVKAHLSYARLVLRKILRERVSDTVASEQDLFQELKELFES